MRTAVDLDTLSKEQLKAMIHARGEAIRQFIGAGDLELPLNWCATRLDGYWRLLQADFIPAVSVLSPLSGRSASCGGAPALVEHIAEHVVGDVGHADLYPGPANADGSDEELHLVLLPGEHMLDGGPDL